MSSGPGTHDSSTASWLAAVCLNRGEESLFGL